MEYLRKPERPITPRSDKWVKQLKDVLPNHSPSDISDLVKSCNYNVETIQSQVAELLENETTDSWATVQTKKDKKAQTAKEKELEARNARVPGYGNRGGSTRGGMQMYARQFLCQ